MLPGIVRLVSGVSASLHDKTSIHSTFTESTAIISIILIYKHVNIFLQYQFPHFFGLEFHAYLPAARLQVNRKDNLTLIHGEERSEAV